MTITRRQFNSFAAAALAALGGQRPQVQVQGEAQLAGEINWLIEHLRWDVADDLAAFTGPAVAHQLARFGQAAAQGLAVLRDLGVADDDARVNPNGGAIALGHPLGASGARLATTAVSQLHQGGGRYALCTMCIGVGQGIAVILERV